LRLTARPTAAENHRRSASNRTVSECGKLFGEPIAATAILDRLMHHSHVITIRGESYRLREKRRSGLIKSNQEPSKATS
jgi:DNA replication protein DnaC